MHHLEEMSGGIGSSFRSLVCSQGWGVKAIPLQISTGLLNEGLDLKCPSKESLWNAGSSEELMNLEPLRGKEKRVFKCRSLASLPPFVTKTIVESGSSDPKDTCFLMLSACKAFYESIKETPSASETKDSLCDLLSHFWAAGNNKMVQTPYAIPSNGEITAWSERLHVNCVRPTCMPNQNKGSIEGRCMG